MLLTGLGCQSTRLAPPAAPEVDPCLSAPSPGPLQPKQSIDEVDTPPELIGGLRGLQRQVKYPTSAKRDGRQGEVIIGFVVDERGCVVQARVLQGVDLRLDAEALRVVRMARFEPAYLQGEPVALTMTMPIGFHVRSGGR